MSISKAQGLSLLLWASFLVSAKGATIIDVSGPNDDNASQSALSGTLAIGFSLASDFTNVSIAAALESFNGDGTFNLNGYLTRLIGPGTTAGTDEVASFSNLLITIPNSPGSAPFLITPFTAFSGLSLSAGNYYLTLSGAPVDSDVFWATSPNDGTLVTVTSGGSVIAPALSGAALDPYLPASTFNDDSGTTALWFQVTGDLADTSGVPEPSSLVLVVPGLVLAWMRRRSFTSQKS